MTTDNILRCLEHTELFADIRQTLQFLRLMTYNIEADSLRERPRINYKT